MKPLRLLTTAPSRMKILEVPADVQMYSDEDFYDAPADAEDSGMMLEDSLDCLP